MFPLKTLRNFFFFVTKTRTRKRGTKAKKQSEEREIKEEALFYFSCELRGNNPKIKTALSFALLVKLALVFPLNLLS